MRVLNKLRRDEEGAILIWVALMMVMLLGFGAIGIDVSYAYAVQRETSNSADAIALAGAQAAAPLVDEGGCTPAAESAAEAAANDMALSGSLDADATDVVPDAQCQADGSLNVKVDVDTTVDTFLGSVIGVDTMNPGASATAEVAGFPSGGLRPLSLCTDTFFDWENVDTNTTFQSDLDHPWHNTDSCGGSPGNFGWIGFDSTSNSTVIDYMEDGYPGVIPDDGWVFGQTGNDLSRANAMEAAADNLIENETIIQLPVISAAGWDGNGHWAQAHVEGVVDVVLCAYAPKNSAPVPTNSCFDLDTWRDSDWTNDSNLKVTGGPNPKPDLIFQWKFVDYTPAISYAGGTTCDPELLGCETKIRLVK